jgi:hypothetical protein
MADLSPLEEKLGEVLGLAQAAQVSTGKVSAMEGAHDFHADLERMYQQAAETERRTDALVEGREDKKATIREKARKTKSGVSEMMTSYLGDESVALDGFEFLSMAKAGELCHWEIVGRMAETSGPPEVRELAQWVIGVQRQHVEKVREASLLLAVEEAQEAAETERA